MKPAPIFDAVTAVLLQGGELYLARRHRKLAAFPGFHAFAGGKVDKTDGNEPLAEPVFAGFEPRLIRGLSRELHEELGYDLIADARNVRAVRQMGIALTPPPAAVRFNTYFFRIDLGMRPPFELHAPELEDGEWATPAEWMRRYRRGELLLAPPTLATV
ncbi:MAG TPA: NUDIX hydrolase, partial [Nevskia sp.]|nr:NUDIX hydrolase [Nevskia sp.]